VLSLDVLHVNDLVLGERLVSEYDEVRETYVTDLERTSRRVAEIVTGSPRRVLVEGHLAHLVTARELVETTLVLRCNPVVLSQRLSKQGFGRAKIRENALAELLDVCLIEAVERYGPDKVTEIDTTGKTIDGVLKEALGVLTEGKRQLYVVDWVTQLEAEGVLDEFLA